MLLSSGDEGGAQVLSAGVRKTIQSIKEIVGNHSDADIYVALKETNMDPNETTQKLLNQDPFHEVKRRKDKKKETSDYQNFAAAEPKTNSVPPVQVPVKNIVYSDRSAHRGGYNRNISSGAIQEFRVVRDNRINQSADVQFAQNLTLMGKGVVTVVPRKSNSTGTGRKQKLPLEQHSSQASSKHADSLSPLTKVAICSIDERTELIGEKNLPLPVASARGTRANDDLLHSTNSANSSVIGVSSSSSVPVHVPSLHYKPSARREVGVVGSQRQPPENSTKQSEIKTYTVAQFGRDGHIQDLDRPFNGISRSSQYNQSIVPESVKPRLLASKLGFSNVQNGRPYHLTGHQRAPHPNKEWKPKTSVKPSAKGTVAAGANTVSSPAGNPDDFTKQEDKMQNDMSRLNISDKQNVIIAAHIRVSEADRRQLTFGSLGIELDCSKESFTIIDDSAEELSIEHSGSLSVSAPESTENEPSGAKDLGMIDEHVRSSGSNSPPPDVQDHLIEENDRSSVQDMDNRVDVVLVQGGDSQSYITESLPQLDASEVSSFSDYNPHIGYDMPYFHPMVEEAVRGPNLSLSEEASSSHIENSIPASTVALVQQQQQQLAQLYPPVHVSHFSNLMPYRQLISPVYLPPVPMPGYSNNPAYNHPSNGSSYLLVPGNNTRVTPNALKFGVQQFKHVPTGNPNGFGNFPNPTGYAINTSGVGNPTANEDSSQLKFKDSLYIPNPQAETPEIWMNSRDLPSMQSSPYYNSPGQTPHPTYLSSHSGHASFTPAVAQSSHMQFSGMYHPPTQPVAITSPHHLGPAIGGNVGVGVGAPPPAAQMGAYQQPQLGHLNWSRNF